jgi:hypothetical protein
MESFDHIDSEKIKDIYCKNGIGFLAVKENLEDNDFMGYLKALLDYFPTIRLIAFEIVNEQNTELEKIFSINVARIESIVINNIYDLAKNCEIFIVNRNTPLDFVTSTSLQKYSNQIFCTEYLKSLANTAMSQVPIAVKNHAGLFGINSSEIERWGNSLQELFYTSIMMKIGIDNFVFDQERSLYQLAYFDTIDYVLNYKGFKDCFIEYRQIHRKIR